MATFCVFDVSNLVYRIASITLSESRGDIEDAINLSLANSVRSMRVPFDKFKANHAVMCFDHFSWRKKLYETYKANRVDHDASEREIEVKNSIIKAINDFKTFLLDNSNSTVLCAPQCEADDMIARWIASHSNDTNIIVSSDSDFKQLVNDKVHLYNATTGILCSGRNVYESTEKKKPKKTDQLVVMFGEKWKVVLDETGSPESFDPAWMLFKKIMTGDRSDNITRAAPPRTMTTTLKEAYNHWGGIAWEKLMTTKRTDLAVEGSETPTVAEIYERNCSLIDFSLIPDEVKAIADGEISSQISKPMKKSLGMKFMLFCREKNMISLGNDAERYVPMLSCGYVNG
jgi:hypothetical protein